MEKLVFVQLVIKETCMGSEDGIHVKTFTAGPESQPVEEKLAGVFVGQGWATLPVVGKPADRETKVVTPDTKVVKPVDKKQADLKANDE